jgi:hypothetical protein
MDARLRGSTRTLTRTRGSSPERWSQASSWYSQPFSAADRALVVLMENGGVDLGIPELVDKLLSSIPGADLIPDSVRGDFVTFLRNKIKSFTDSLLEGAELTLNRYDAAKPNLFGEVIVLRNGTATYGELKGKLHALTQAGKVVDIFILTHGNADLIAANGDIDGAKIRAMKTELGRPLSIRAVYMMNCVGSTLNQAWLDAGARTSSGSIKNNYIPEPSMFFFWSNWKAGQSFETAVTSAYRKTIGLMNDAVRGFVAALPIPGSSLLAGRIDLSDLEFVRDSAPVIVGQRSVTISTDDLTFTQSLSSGLATTVLPVSALQSVAAGATAATRSVSPHGLELLRAWEGDSPALADKVAAALQAVNASVKAALNQNQLDALVSFVCGIGVAPFQRSTLLRLLNDGDAAAVPSEIRKWSKARQNGSVVEVPELVRRRASEAELYQQTAPAAAARSLSSVGYAMSGVDAEIAGILPVIKQPTGMTCWAAVMTMMYSWRNNVSIGIREALATFGQQYVERFDRGEGLDANSAATLYDTGGLVRITSFNPTIDEWARLLSTAGPLYVDVGFGSSNTTHAIIVRAVRGDGTATGTTITFVDPADAQTKSLRFSDFLAHYEAPGAVNNWPHVIVHWPAAAAATQQSYSYVNPSSAVAEAASWAYQQNPGAVAGIAIADAIQIGLGAVSVAQAGVSASSGSFTLNYDRAQRLLTNEARQAMPGAQVAKQKYRRNLLNINPGKGIGMAVADIVIEWEGNPYGEIGTPVIDRNLTTSTDWSRSSANISITKLERIPLPNTDPRTWPIVYSYSGAYDPVGNGHWEFQGEFEINAFGGLKFTKHQVVSRSLLEIAISKAPEEYVKKASDVIAAVPPLPQDQLAYLRTKLP